MKSLLNPLVIAVALAVAGTAAAQEASIPPNYGEIHGIGYPDPNLIQVTAGGSIDLNAAPCGCRGFVSNAPDVRYFHRPIPGLPLIISVQSESDTTLLINTPSGRWTWDDDSGEGVNPSIRIEEPEAGAYEIWVGTYRPEPAPAMLSISEMYTY